MEKDFKYWLYYNTDDHSLYAYTDQKELAREFESERDMTLLHRVKKRISREDVNKLARDYQTYYLVKKSLTSYDTKNEALIKVNLVMSMMEYMCVTNASIQVLTNLSSQCFYPIDIFNDELQEALRDLQYNIFYTSNYRGMDILFENDRNENVIIDELGLFLSLYSHMMTK